MARPLRVEYPGAFYHVMHRGNAGEDIFISSRDRERFLEYLANTVERYEIKVHTYCLMSNHYHLLVETPHPNLSQAIKWINVSYAAYFNRKQGTDLTIYPLLPGLRSLTGGKDPAVSFGRTQGQD